MGYRGEGGEGEAMVTKGSRTNKQKRKGLTYFIDILKDGWRQALNCDYRT